MPLALLDKQLSDCRLSLRESSAAFAEQKTTPNFSVDPYAELGFDCRKIIGSSTNEVRDLEMADSGGI